MSHLSCICIWYTQQGALEHIHSETRNKSQVLVKHPLSALWAMTSLRETVATFGQTLIRIQHRAAHSASHLDIHQEGHVVIGCLLACLWIKRRGCLKEGGIALHCEKRQIFKKINGKFTKYFLSRLFVTPWSWGVKIHWHWQKTWRSTPPPTSTFSIKGPNYHTEVPGSRQAF